MNVFVFDIETVPDVNAGRRQLGIDNSVSDESVAQAMLSLAKEAQGTAFVRHHWQKVVAISVAFRHQDQFKIWSLGEPEEDEAALIQRFFSGIEKYVPTLVTWNGGGFDLPVLHYRALLHGVESQHYWETGQREQSFKFNNYLSRYHGRHLDLMDTLAAYQSRACAKLDDIAHLLGLPGKLGMSGEEVLNYYFLNDIKRIRNYCEIDVLNTYLIYLRFQLIRGHLSRESYENEIQLTRRTLEEGPHHFQEFLSLWKHSH